MVSEAGPGQPLDAEVMLGAVLADLNAGLAFLDGDLRFVQVNERLAQMNGSPVADHLGRTPMELLPELDPRSYLPHLKRALAGDPVREIEVAGSTPARPDGVWQEDFYPVRRDGRVAGVMIVARDVGAEREAAAAAAQAAGRVEQLQAIGESVLTHRRLDELLDDIVERTRLLLQADTATLLLDIEHTGTLRVEAAAGLSEEVRAGVAVPVGRGVAGRVTAAGRPLLVDDLDAVEVVSPYLRESGLKSLVATPLTVDEITIGVLHVASRRHAAFNEQDQALLAAAAGRAALVVDRAIAYDRQRTVAETLQRSLLPGRLPDLPQLSLAARYRPAGAGMSVGGDWYDAQQLPDGHLALVIGDVVGHGVQAAALMGQLRTALRAHLSDGHTPATALQQLDELVCQAGPDLIATAAVAILDPEDGTLHLAIAGHPPPLLRQPDGTTRLLDEHAGPVLGLGVGGWPTQALRLPPGGALLLYTDGLVERRSADLDQGIRRAEQALADCTDPDSCVTTLIETTYDVGPGAGDDIAVLLASRPGDAVDRLTLSTDGPAELSWLRQQVRNWLQKTGATAHEVDEVVLAITEAVTEATGGQQQKPVEITMNQAGDRLHAQIRSNRPAEPPVGTDRGRSLLLLEALTDLLVVDTQHGLELRLSRTLGRSNGEPEPPADASGTATAR